jgi:hypothetical protein
MIQCGHGPRGLSGPTSHGLVYWLALGLSRPVATHVRSEERRASRASPHLPLYVKIKAGSSQQEGLPVRAALRAVTRSVRRQPNAVEEQLAVNEMALAW